MHIHTRFFKESSAGYSLLGTAMLVVVLGLLISVGLIIHKNYQWNIQNNKTNENLKTVYEALLKYRYENNRLPCPAQIDAPLDSPEYGREQPSCAGTVSVPGHRGNGNVRYGAVPIRSLNLPDSVSVDGWGHRYTYAVTEYYTSAAPDLGFYVDKGAIRILDANKQDVTVAPGNVVFTVLSPGSDKRGAYNINGILQEECDISSPAGENCDNDDSVFLSSIYRQWDTAKTEDAYTTTMAYLANSKAYRWVSSNWSECNCASEIKTQKRQVTCVDEYDNPPYPSNPSVNDTFCAASDKPEVEKACVAYCWDAGPWTPCDCSGVSTRIAYCRTNSHERVGSAFCRAFAKPPETRTCWANCDDDDDGNSGDPLIFDLTGDGISTRSADNGVLFDMENNGDMNRTGWINERNGFLVRDRNKNGRVDNQSELFGTIGKPAFDELKDYDSNGDGDVTPEDKAWSKLKIWQDKNGNGLTEPGELRSLDYWGIRRIPLAHEDVYLSDSGNDVTGKGKFEQILKDGTTVLRDVWEVFFSYFKKEDTANQGPVN